MNNRSFYVHTMGCKLNQYDSYAMQQQLLDKSWEQTDDAESADLIILNSCTITNNSDKEAKQLARRFKKKNPRVKLMLTGCSVQEQEEKLEEMEVHADLFVSNQMKFQDDWIDFLSSDEDNQLNEPQLFLSQSNIFQEKIADFLSINSFAGHARAFIKIQDGCDLRCSYCIVPFVRGNNRSVSPQLILHSLHNIYDKGFREAVLTGIHIGSYGQDNHGKHKSATLQKLLQKIEKEGPPIRIRLSSIDSNELSRDLIDQILSSEKIQPHFHIPLQSGSDRILQLMKRSYDRKNFINTVEYIHKNDPSAFIGSDIIVGFPTETDADFQDSLNILKDYPLSQSHVFSFSAKKGTKAYSMPGQLTNSVIKKRSRILNEQSKINLHRFHHSQIGQQRDAIILHKKQWTVITDNYITLPLLSKSKDTEIKVKDLIPIKISHDSEKGLYARMSIIE